MNKKNTTNPDVFDLGFKVELLQRKSNAPAVVLDKPDDKHHFIPEGEYMMDVKYARIDRETVEKDSYGRPYIKAPHHLIRFAPLGSKDPNEYYDIELALGETDESGNYTDSPDERKFRLAINNRSNGDMFYKFGLAGFRPSDIDIKTVCRYIHKYPVKMRSEHTEFVNDIGDTIRSKYPKVRLWNPEDFMKDEEVAWAAL